MHGRTLGDQRARDMVTRSSELFEPSGRVRVLLVDDHAILRQGLRGVRRAIRMWRLLAVITS